MSNLDSPPGGWLAPIGGTRDLLRCVRIVTARALEQWVYRGLVEFYHPRRRLRGRGAAIECVALDVLQVATLAELAVLGVPLPETPRVWVVVRDRVLGETTGDAGPDPAHQVVLAPDPEANAYAVRDVRAAGFGPVLAELGSPGAVVALDIEALVAKVAARIAALAPEAVA